MSEKVLGFYKKDADLVLGEPYFKDEYRLKKDKLVSVRLASESVGLKELKDFWEDNDKLRKDYPRLFIDNLLSFIEKEAKKK